MFLDEPADGQGCIAQLRKLPGMATVPVEVYCGLMRASLGAKNVLAQLLRLPRQLTAKQLCQLINAAVQQEQGASGELKALVRYVCCLLPQPHCYCNSCTVWDKISVIALLLIALLAPCQAVSTVAVPTCAWLHDQRCWPCHLQHTQTRNGRVLHHLLLLLPTGCRPQLPLTISMPWSCCRQQ